MDNILLQNKIENKNNFNYFYFFYYFFSKYFFFINNLVSYEKLINYKLIKFFPSIMKNQIINNLLTKKKINILNYSFKFNLKQFYFQRYGILFKKEFYNIYFFFLESMRENFYLFNFNEENYDLMVINFIKFKLFFYHKILNSNNNLNSKIKFNQHIIWFFIASFFLKKIYFFIIITKY